MYKYIAFEGNEGSGKTTLSKKIAESLNAFWTYEPNGETEELKLLRKLTLSIKANITPISRELLLLANRNIQQNQILKPVFEKGLNIVTDRSFLSGLVYASISNVPFHKWEILAQQSEINYIPDVIVFCKSSIRKIDIEEDNKYDVAQEEILLEIDKTYLDALTYLKQSSKYKNIKVIHFYNDFSKSLEENCLKLLKLLE